MSGMVSIGGKTLRVEGLEDRRLLAIDVAVIHAGGDPSAAANVGYQKIANQLNDDTHFDFSAVMVAPTAVNESSLAAFDVVIIGNNGSAGGDQIALFASALRNWVEGGGAAVMVGWGMYGTNLGSGLTDIDAIMPIDVDSDYGPENSGKSITFDAGPIGSIITAGVTPELAAGWYETASNVAIEPGSEQFATLDGRPLGVADPSVGSGRSVYLGITYSGIQEWDPPQLRDPNFDRLLEQAVNWAGSAATNAPPTDVFVDDEWTITVDNGPAGFSYGDIVSSDADGDDDTANFANKIYGFNAFDSIEAAIDAVAEGGNVNVNAGEFIEAIAIDKALTLAGIGDATVVTSPAMTGVTAFEVAGLTRQAVVGVIDATGAVTIKNLRVNGAGQGGTVTPGNDFHGIGIKDSNVTVDGITVVGVRDSVLNGIQRGRAIFAGATSAIAVTVTNSKVSDYQKNGIDLRGDIDATVTNNTVTGVGATTQIAQNGIVLLGGATGTISGNTISGHDYTPSDTSAAGVLLFNSGDSVSVTGNSISGNEIGLSNQSAYPVDAHGNWWGSANGPSADPGNPYDQYSPAVTGDSVEGDVDFTPWLTSGVDTAPSAPGFQTSEELDEEAPGAPTLDLTTDSGNPSDNVTNDATPSFGGATDPNSLVAVGVWTDANSNTVVDDSEVSNITWVQADGEGNYVATLGALADSATHKIVARAYDQAGNLGPWSAALSITIDEAISTPTVDLIDASDSASPNTDPAGTNADNITNINTPTFQGTAEPNSTVQLLDGGVPIAGAVATADGSGQWQIEVALVNGVHNIAVRSTDQAGNSAVSSPVLVVTIDTSITANSTPDMTVASDDGAFNDDNITSDNTPTFTGVTEPGAYVELLIDGNVAATGKANPMTGVWTLTPLAAIPDGSAHTARARVTDKAGNFATSGALSFTIDSINEPPIAGDDVALPTNEDTPVNIDVLANDSAGPAHEDQTLTITAKTNGANGLVSINGDGTLTYTPNANFHGTDTFTYTVSDSSGGTATATVTVTIASVNDAPDADNDAATTAEDASVIIDVLANDKDVDNPSGTPTAGLTVGIATAPEHGSVVVNVDGTITYTPNDDYFGSDLFTYTISDGVLSGTATVNVSVTPVNDAPIAVDDELLTASDEDVVRSILITSLTENDSRGPANESGQTLNITAVGNAVGGTVSLSGLNVLFTPTLNYNGPASFEYTVSDGGLTDVGKVTFTIASVNDAPIANNDFVGTAEETPVVINVKANDTDVENSTAQLIVDPVLVTLPEHGTAVVNANGSITYTPNADYIGSDSFTYTLTDLDGGSDTATVTVSVGGVNDPPIANDDVNAASDNGMAVTGDVVANDTDVDGDIRTVAFPTGTIDGQFGTLTLNSDGTYSYIANDSLPAGFTGEDVFEITITDGDLTDVSTLTISVSGLNDAPVAADDTDIASDDGAAVTGNVLTNDIDVDGDALVVTNPGSINGVYGTLTLNSDGSYSYVVTNESLAAGVEVIDVFNVTISDGTAPATSTLTFHISGVNDAPVAVDDAVTTNEDAAIAIPAASLTANDADVDGDAPTVTGVSNPVHGEVSFDELSGVVTFTPAANFNGEASFDYTVSDGNGGTATGTVTITVNPLPDAPLAVNDSATTNEDTSVVINVLSNDKDADNPVETPTAGLTVTAATVPAHGSVVINFDGTITYTPHANYFGADSFVYTLQDASGLFSTATVNVTVTSENDAPTAAPDTVTTDEDVAIAIPAASLTANDTDVENNTLTVTGVSNPVNGDVSFDELSGVITFTPAPNFSGEASFDYTVTDANGGTDTGSVTVTVAAVNDNPTALDDAVTVSEDSSDNVINVLGNDLSDPDGGETLSVTEITQPTNGSATLVGGVVKYTPNADYFGADSFTYTISDGSGGTATATVNVTVSNLNDAPTAVHDAVLVGQNSGPNVVDVLANDEIAPDAGETLTVTAVGAAANGVASLTGGVVSYTPNPGFFGSDSFTYTVSDGNGGTSTATVNITLTFSADFNVDGKVEGDDLAIWKAGYGTSPANHSDGDENNDDVIDGSDFLAWQRQSGSALPPAVAAVTTSEVATIEEVTPALEAAQSEEVPLIEPLQVVAPAPLKVFEIVPSEAVVAATTVAEFSSAIVEEPLGSGIDTTGWWLTAPSINAIESNEVADFEVDAVFDDWTSFGVESAADHHVHLPAALDAELETFGEEGDDFELAESLGEDDAANLAWL